MLACSHYQNVSKQTTREEGHDEEEEEDELYRDVNINQGRGIQTTLEVKDSHVTLTLVNPDGQQQSSSVSSQFVTSMLNPTPDAGMESIFETTSQMDAQTPTSVAPLLMTTPTLTASTIATITTTQQAPLPPTTDLNTLLQNLPNFSLLFGFDNRLRTLEANFSEFMQTNQFAEAVFAIPEIVQRYMHQQLNESVKVAVQIQSDQDHQGVGQRTSQGTISKILPTIEQTMNEQLKAEVLTRSSHSSKTSYAIAADLSEIELKNILIKKMEGNKYIQRSDEQRNLYKALVEAYESDKIILDTYGETITLKRRRDDDANKDEEPSAVPDWGSKRRIEGKEPESASASTETATRSAGRSTQGTKSRQTSASESAIAEEPMQTTFEMEEPAHPEFETGKLTKLTVEERFAFNVSLRMFTRSIMTQRRVEDLQLGVKSYQKKLNLTKPDTYRSDLKRTEAYIAYSNLRGFIYQNKDKKNRLMQIDELHKFSDGTLTDVRNALDDRLKGIQMQYFPKSIWRKSDKDRAVAMIQAIDRRLKTRRIMRSLKRFVGGRLYEGDFKMLQRTI
nr:hypothetical protein [Tanacetum cinerariifolium]